jgi:hypothetical protein
LDCKIEAKELISYQSASEDEAKIDEHETSGSATIGTGLFNVDDQRERAYTAPLYRQQIEEEEDDYGYRLNFDLHQELRENYAANENYRTAFFESEHKSQASDDEKPVEQENVGISVYRSNPQPKKPEP